MAKRQKVEIVLANTAALDSILAELCQIKSRMNAKEAAMQKELTAVKDRYNNGLEGLSEADAAALTDAAREARRLEGLEALGEDYKLKATAVEQYATVKRQEVFGDAKTVERLNGILTWRLSPPKVEKVGRKWTWETVLEALIAWVTRYKKFRDFVRQMPSVNKEAILTAYASKKVTNVQLAAVGIEVTQEETFGMELKLEKAPEAVGTPKAA